MSEFPRTEIEGLSVPRMLIGTNWFMGFSHTSRAKDKFINETMTPSRIADVLEVFLAAGIDAIVGQAQRPKALEAIAEAQDRTGKKLILISTPTINVDDGREAEAENARIFDSEVAADVAVCMPHTSCTDVLVDQRARCIRNMDRICEMIRERGMIPGLSTHLPESVIYADETGLDVATYIQIYNAAGFLMPLEVDWVHRIIHNAAKPVITIKPLAAGRLHPFVGLAFSWATIREQDMVAVGTMTPDEAREVIDMSLSLLEGRGSAVPLQRTRSKSTVETSE